MARTRIGLALGIVVALGMGIFACSNDEPVDAGPDTAADASGDGGKNDGSSTDASREDTGSAEAGPKDADADADAPRIPGLVTDLTATAISSSSVRLTWTAPCDHTGTGTVKVYDIRWSITPITTDVDFFAADPVPPPQPVAPGGAQTTTIEGLTPDTLYYVALRAGYDNGEYGPRTQTVTVTTYGRARFLISEIAPLNTAASGGDFVELVATKPGLAGGLVVLSGYGSVLHEFARLEVQVGDRVVVHASGLPGPAGYVQEDASNNKTASTSTYASANAYDVYSARADLSGSVGTIIVAEPGDLAGAPGLVQDMVPYSDRSQVSLENPSQDLVSAYLALGTVTLGWQPNEWTPVQTLEEFEAFELDDSLCPLMAGTLNASGNTAPLCGGPAGNFTNGLSFKRTGTTDTNTAADFTVGSPTRGAPN